MPKFDEAEVQEILGILGKSQAEPTTTSGQQTADSFSAELAASEPKLDIPDRMKLSFLEGDPDRAKQFLKEKFAFVDQAPEGTWMVGDDPRNLSPVAGDGGFWDILGFLADHARTIPSIAAQVVGSAAGSVAGPGGTIAGGAVGAGVGEAFSKGISGMMGAQEPVGKTATDVGMATAFGAGGEALGIGAGRALSFLSPRFAGLVDKGIERSGNQAPAVADKIAKIGKFIAGVDEKDTIDALAYGASKTLTPQYLDDQYITKISSDFAKGITSFDSQVGKAVEAGDAWAIKNFGSKTVDLSKPGDELLQALASDKVGRVINPVTGALERHEFMPARDFRTIQTVLKGFFNETDHGLVPKSLSFRELLYKRKQADQFLTGYFNAAKTNPIYYQVVKNFLGGIRETIGEATLPPGVVTQGLDPSNMSPFLLANKAYFDWKRDLDLLAANGLDLTNVANLGRTIKEGEVFNKGIENFAKNFQGRTNSARGAFERVAEKLPVRYKGGGIKGTDGTLVDELRKFNAAQGFKKTSPDRLRLLSTATLFGLGGWLTDRDSSYGALKGLAISFLVGSPAGFGQILKAGERMGGVAGRVAGQASKAGTQASRTISREGARALRGVISQSARERASQK